MANAPFSFRNRVEGGFMDDFDAKLIKFGFTQGFIPADKTGTGEGRPSFQAFALWQPIGEDAEDAKPQPSWYGMGQKEYVFGGKVEQVHLGDKDTTQEVYENITEGPPLTKQSRFGQFLERLAKLGFDPDGADGSVFEGLVCHLKREKYDQGRGSGAKSDKEALMPTAILSKPGKTAAPAAPATKEEAKAAAEDAEAALCAMVDGKADKDMPTLDKEALKAIGLSLAKVYSSLPKLVKAGKLAKDGEGVYHIAAE